MSAPTPKETTGKVAQAYLAMTDRGMSATAADLRPAAALIWEAIAELRDYRREGFEQDRGDADQAIYQALAELADEEPRAVALLAAQLVRELEANS